MALKTKLMLSFAIIILLNAMVGAYAVAQLSAIRDNARGIIDSDLPLLNGFEDATAAANAEMLAMRQYRYSQNAVYRDAFAQAHESWLASLETLRPLLAKPGMSTYSELLEQAAQIESDFSGQFQQLATHNAVSRETDQRFDADALDGEIDASYSNLETLLDSLGNRIKQYIADDTSGIYESARFLTSVLIGGVLLALLLGSAAAIWMIRSTMQQLGLDPAVLNNMAQRQADGYLDADDQEHRGVAGAMQAVSLKLRDTVGIVQQSTQSVSAVSDQLSSAAEQLSTGMATQAERVSMIATASTEMAQTSVDIARNVNTVQQNSVEALELAQAGGAKVSQSATSMSEILKHVTVASGQANELETKATRVQEVVSIISSIAEQTNLLALNAAIEAARAGEAGRGFAVVADEVRTLAERSTQSTHEINTIIGSMQEGVGQVVGSMALVTDSAQEGNEIAQETAGSFKQIVAAMQSLQEHVTQNAASIDEMSSTAEQVTTDIQAISEIAQESLASSEHIAQSSSELVENMHSLNNGIAFFKLS